jgi:hypothetical protein
MEFKKTLVIGYSIDTKYPQFSAMRCYDFDMQDGPEFKRLATYDLAIDLPDFDERDALVESLRMAKVVVINEATLRAEQLEEKIQQLLALPSSVPEAS